MLILTLNFSTINHFPFSFCRFINSLRDRENFNFANKLFHVQMHVECVCVWMERVLHAYVHFRIKTSKWNYLPISCRLPICWSVLLHFLEFFRVLLLNGLNDWFEATKWRWGKGAKRKKNDDIDCVRLLCTHHKVAIELILGRKMSGHQYDSIFVLVLVWGVTVVIIVVRFEYICVCVFVCSIFVCFFRFGAFPIPPKSPKNSQNENCVHFVFLHWRPLSQYVLDLCIVRLWEIGQNERRNNNKRMSATQEKENKKSTKTKKLLSRFDQMAQNFSIYLNIYILRIVVGDRKKNRKTLKIILSFLAVEIADRENKPSST